MFDLVSGALGPTGDASGHKTAMAGRFVHGMQELHKNGQSVRLLLLHYGANFCNKKNNLHFQNIIYCIADSPRIRSSYCIARICAPACCRSFRRSIGALAPDRTQFSLETGRKRPNRDTQRRLQSGEGETLEQQLAATTQRSLSCSLITLLLSCSLALLLSCSLALLLLCCSLAFLLSYYSLALLLLSCSLALLLSCSLALLLSYYSLALARRSCTSTRLRTASLRTRRSST